MATPFESIAGEVRDDPPERWLSPLCFLLLSLFSLSFFALCSPLRAHNSLGYVSHACGVLQPLWDAAIALGPGSHAVLMRLRPTNAVVPARNR